jgi:hypothetical protein
MLGIVDEPLAFLPDAKTRPPKAALDEIMESFRESFRSFGSFG